MVYDRRPSRDNNHGNWQESSSFDNTRGNSLPSSSYHDRELIERLRKYYQQRQAEAWAAKQQQWFDSLPVFDLGEETERNEKSTESRQNQRQERRAIRLNVANATWRGGAAARSLSDSVKSEESVKKKKNSGLFGWLNRGKEKTANSADKHGKDTSNQQQQNQGGQSPSANTGIETKNHPEQAKSRSKMNQGGNNSAHTPGGSSASSDNSANVAPLAPIPVEPIFIAPSLDLAPAEQENILGKNADGSVIYLSDNPSRERARAKAGVGISELPSSQTERIYTQQQELAQTALDLVVDRGESAGASIKTSKPDSLTRIDSATKEATASIETEMEKQLSAIASLMNQSRSSISAASNKEIKRIENHHANTIGAIDARTETAVNQLEASAEKITQQMASSNATFNRLRRFAVA